MNNLIVYPLLLLVVIGSFYQLVTLTSIDFSQDQTQTETLQQNQTLDGTESELEIEGGSLNIDFTMSVGLIVIIISAIALGLIGINVLGSGLSDNSVKIIWNGIIYYGLWGIFSALGFNVFTLIPVGFGLLIWFILTMVYSLGVFHQMGSR